MYKKKNSKQDTKVNCLGTKWNNYFAHLKCSGARQDDISSFLVNFYMQHKFTPHYMAKFFLKNNTINME